MVTLLREKVVNFVLDILSLDILNGNRYKIVIFGVLVKGWNVNLEFRRNLGYLDVDLGEIYMKIISGWNC